MLQRNCPATTKPITLKCMKKKLYLAVFFALGLFCLVLFQNATLPTTPAQICTATDLSSWINCKEQIKNKSSYKIIVNGTIHCTGDICNTAITNKASVTITSDSLGVFVRESGFASPLLSFSRVSEVNISNITIKEPKNIPVQPQPGLAEINSLCEDAPKSQCGITLSVSGAENVSIKNVSIYNAKRIALGIAYSKNVMVENSYIDDSFHFGSWASKNEKLTIQNSLFTNSRSNAIIADLSKSIETKIIGNRFTNNHRATAFHVCDSSKTAPCPGGQIDLAVESSNVEVAHNIFENAKMSIEFPEDKNHDWISGIEFESKNISNVLIHDNIIRNHSGSDFFLNMPNITDPKIQLVFKDNRTCNNRTQGFNYLEEFIWTQEISKINNVTDCSDSKSAMGTLSMTSAPCIVKLGQKNCSTQISWNTRNAPNACLFVASSRKLVACSPSYQNLSIDWITNKVVKFELRAERNYFSRKLSEVTVKPIIEETGKPHILNAGLGCDDQNCIWATGLNVEKGCFVNIYNTNYVKIETIKDPICQVDLVTFKVPAHIIKQYSKVIINVANQNRKWSNSFAVSLIKSEKK